MSQELELSVIIPAYNAEKFLAEAVKSVLQQTWAGSYEIVIYNDGSQDDTQKVAEQFGPPVTVYGQNEAGGTANARNSAIEKSRGKFLAFLDADDIWLPEKLSLQFAHLVGRERELAVFGAVQEFDQNGPRGDFRKSMLPTSCLVPKEVFHRIGLFDTSLKVAEFAEWLSRAQDIGVRLEVVDAPVARRRIHSDNIGIRERDNRRDYLEVARRRLARRRAQEK